MGKATEKQKLWRAFAEYIRLRDAPNGFGNCISCNKIVAYPNPDGLWHAGHLYPRSVVYNTLYFHEMNVHGQCHYCNTHLEGDTMRFRDGIIRRYGEYVLEELEIARAIKAKWYEHDYKELAKEYRKKVRDMKKVRGIA